MLGRFLLGSTVALVLVLVGCAKKEETSKTEVQTKKTEAVTLQVTDPVCGMRIDMENALTAKHAGRTYYFCAERCKEDFLKDSHKYIKETAYVDPVCGMEVGHGRDVPHITARHQGKLYHFCSVDCKDRFEQEPKKYHRVP